MSRKTLYKLCFVNQGTIYEIFARVVAPSDIMGFVEVEQLVFGETSSIVFDPSEEKLQHEFAGIKRTHTQAFGYSHRRGGNTRHRQDHGHR